MWFGSFFVMLDSKKLIFSHGTVAVSSQSWFPLFSVGGDRDQRGSDDGHWSQSGEEVSKALGVLSRNDLIATCCWRSCWVFLQRRHGDNGADGGGGFRRGRRSVLHQEAHRAEAGGGRRRRLPVPGRRKPQTSRYLEEERHPAHHWIQVRSAGLQLEHLELMTLYTFLLRLRRKCFVE